MAKPASSPAAARQPASRSSWVRTQYLILYNFVSAILWLVVLGRVLCLVYLVGFSRVHSGVTEFSKWTQSLAVLEIVHAATGLVRSPISTTVMQVASRLLLVWGIIYNFHPLARSPAYSSMLTAWSVTEVIRYSYFVLNLSGYHSRVITWLRYNTFYVLYPMGISSECWLIYRAVTPAGKMRAEYAWALQLILIIYIPGSYILFSHMMAQRRKVARGKQTEKAE